MAISDLAVRCAKPGQKTTRLFDGGGLYLEVTPAGGKLWRLKYRFDGKEKVLALGKYPEISLKDARERRDEARKLPANEVDPDENRKQQKAAKIERSANSFEVVAREWIAKNKPTWTCVNNCTQPLPMHDEAALPRPERRFTRYALVCIRPEAAGGHVGLQGLYALHTCR